MPISRTLKADLLLLVVTLLAAAGWLFSKEALVDMPPLLFIGIRFLLAGTTLCVVGRNGLSMLSRADWWVGIRMGALFGVAIMLWVSGLFHGPHVGEGAFICSLGVILVPVTAALFFKEKPAPITWVAIPVAMLGLACLSLKNGLTLAAGQWFYVAAACVFSFHFILNARVVAQVPALLLTAIQLTVVGILALTCSSLLEAWPTSILPSTWGWLLASVLIATSLRFFLQTYAQGMASASHAAVIMVLEPVWTSLIGIFWFDETMDNWQFVGCGLIFTALMINRWRVIQQMLRGHTP